MTLLTTFIHFLKYVEALTSSGKSHSAIIVKTMQYLQSLLDVAIFLAPLILALSSKSGVFRDRRDDLSDLEM